MLSLSLLWGLVNALMIVAYFPLLSVYIPSNVLIVDLVFYQIATFDILPTEWFMKMFKKSTSPYERDV